MTRYTLSAAAALLATTSIATAGGLDRSILSVSPLFEEGNYVEFTFSAVIPEVSGTVGGGAVSSNDMASDYFNFGFAYRHEINEQFALGLFYSNAYGAAVDYTDVDAGYPFTGFTAELNGTALSLLGQYSLNDRISVYGGLRYVTMSAVTGVPAAGNVNDYDNDGDLGYVLGAAYEIPEIALRASLTYTSATNHENDITVNGLNALGVGAATTGEYTMPQTVALDFQTGVAEGTLVLASIRWSDWSETVIPTQSALGVIDYDNDTWAYTLGAARRLSEELAVVGRVTYEAPNDLPASNLAPTDGLFGISLGAVYDVSESVTLTGGVNYSFLGDATTETIGADFSDNRAFGVGLQIGYSF